MMHGDRLEAELKKKLDEAFGHYIDTLDSLNNLEALFKPRNTYGDNLNPAWSKVVILAHAVMQAGDRDSEIEDELGWVEAADESQHRVARIRHIGKSGISRDLSPRLTPIHRVEFQAALHEQRTVDGQKVQSPFGPGYAATVLSGAVGLPN